MKKMIYIAAAGLALTLTGCTDARWSKVAALGAPGRVTCYSGGVLRFDDYSTGKIENSEQSDGYYFRSRSTGKLVETSGDCTIQYGAPAPADWKPVLP